MDVHNTEAEYSRAICCNVTDSGPMQVGHSLSRSAGVLAAVGAGRNRPGGRAETDGGINEDIRDRVRGGVGRESKRGHGRRRVGVSGSKQVNWSGAEDG